MKKLFFFSLLVFSVPVCFGQDISATLSGAYKNFETDAQLKNASASLYVIDAKTGEVVFDRNSDVGLATASTLKIVTAATAYELLRRDFRYQTKLARTGKINGHSLSGDIVLLPSGDPTLGSWRWKSTSDTAVLNDMIAAVKKLNITSYKNIAIDDRGWEGEVVPDGWMWEDIGNYYGAGAAGFNWRENQFDIVLRSGTKTGSPVTIVNTRPSYMQVKLKSLVEAAAKGTGDNAYVYYPLYSASGVVRGTIPVQETAFVISATNPQAQTSFVSWFQQNLKKQLKLSSTAASVKTNDTTVFFSHSSPALDSIVYWFLKKSINLYGEALVKTMAFQKSGKGNTETGVKIIRDFWKEKGIAPTELNIVDGSGLSPLDRVTTHAQVKILQHAQQQSWFNGFYDALPVYNGMKIKSGTIHGVKGFCGYHTAADGRSFIFSFLVNNYNGSAGSLVNKMYKVLNVLK